MQVSSIFDSRLQYREKKRDCPSRIYTGKKNNNLLKGRYESAHGTPQKCTVQAGRFSVP